VRQANASAYGLGAAVFTNDIARALGVAHALQAGSVWVNCATMVEPQVPYGGVKQSGIGREGGADALASCVPPCACKMDADGVDRYTNVKAVHVNLGTPAPN
jgi:aldehyde dehydrogenase (NAD+)